MVNDNNRLYRDIPNKGIIMRCILSIFIYLSSISISYSQAKLNTSDFSQKLSRYSSLDLGINHSFDLEGRINDCILATSIDSAIVTLDVALHDGHGYISDKVITDSLGYFRFDNIPIDSDIRIITKKDGYTISSCSFSALEEEELFSPYKECLFTRDLCIRKIE